MSTHGGRFYRLHKFIKQRQQERDMILKRPDYNSAVSVQETCPKGTFMAVCIKADEQLQVERRKYQSMETEPQDVVTFWFGLKDKAGNKYVVRTREFRIFSTPKSNLVKTLSAWNGGEPPWGSDLVTWAEGRGAQISVTHNISAKTGKTYANVGTIGPVMDGFESLVPAKEDFAIFLRSETSETTEAPSATEPEADDSRPF